MTKPAYHIEGIPVYEAFMDPSQSNFPAHKMTPEYITIHETENHDEGADAEMHARYLLNSAWGRKASWQYTVDENCIYQHARNDQSCWAAGDGSGDGNRASINIETCENEGSDFQKTIKNVQALVRHLMEEENIPLHKVVNHRKWSGKNCPNNILKYWDSFIDGVERKTEAEPINIKPQPPKNNVNNSIVDYLISIGKDHDLDARKEYAKDYDIKGYKGTALQNLELLRKMQKGGPSREIDEPQERVSSYKGDSIVEYLNSIKVDSSFKNRSRLATDNGIKGYKGTASQNLELLRKLQNVPVKKEPAKDVPKGDLKTDSIVDYLRSVGISPSFVNRKGLAARYGITNYVGTAAQNTLLLKKLRKR